jgi:RNA polymerase sigma-70 factor (ECF subfamily)
MPRAIVTMRTEPPLEQGRTREAFVEQYLDVRPRLLRAAYRTLGSWTEAEDVVQQAWLRWHAYDRKAVDNPEAFLVTTTRRLAINTACSARMRLEVGAAGPRSAPAAAAEDPALGIEQQDAVDHAIRLLLERLSPIERAAYLLRQAFDYPYGKIAELLRVSQPNARQLVSRAGRQLAGDHRRPVDGADHRRLVHAFVAAARHGEVGVLEALLVRAASCAPGTHPATRAA